MIRTRPKTSVCCTTFQECRDPLEWVDNPGPGKGLKNDIDEEILKQLPDDIRKEIEAERKAKVRERRGNSKVPSYLDFYSTSSSSEDDAATGTH